MPPKQQKEITSFFKLNNEKSKKVKQSPNKLEENALKKRKTSHVEEKDNVLDSENVTPVKKSPNAKESSNSTSDQKNKMKLNKLTAEILLQSKKTPALHKSIGTGWFEALKSEFTKTYFEKLSSYMVSEREKSTIYPPDEEVFSWTRFCDIRDVKVVILGQDPYHGTGQAHGLCFSVQKGIAVPPSLLNMYKELENDVTGFKRPNHGYLAGWAEQGVLLLNACLTVRAHNANSHKNQGWEKFTDAVIKSVSENNEGVVFLLWGSYAQKKASVVDNKKHHLLNAPHPSPLSAHRGFLGCKHFSMCNELLSKANKKPIDWTNLPKQE